MSTLLATLSEYDGKHKDVLEEVRDRFEPDNATLKEAVALAANADSGVAAGATWVLRAWIEGGAEFSARLVAQLARRLGDIDDQWAQLHVCQTARSLKVPASQAATFAEFFESCFAGRKPLVRAWAMDGLHRLSLAHPRYAKTARRALEAGLHDPAASVRARVRRIQQGD